MHDVQLVQVCQAIEDIQKLLVIVPITGNGGITFSLPEASETFVGASVHTHSVIHCSSMEKQGRFLKHHQSGVLHRTARYWGVTNGPRVPAA